MRPTARKRTFGGGLALLLLLAAGCAQPRSVGSYFANRGRDFAECFKGSAGYGWGVHARVEAILIGAGMGLARGRKYGWDGAGGVGQAAWNKIAASAWLPIIFEYNVDARGVAPGAALGPFTELRLADKTRPDLPAELVLLRGDAVKSGYNWRLQKRPVAKWTRWADLYWIEADVTAMPVSLRFGFNPTEFLDWLGGLACFDILGDDRNVAGASDRQRDGRTGVEASFIGLCIRNGTAAER